MKIFFASLIYFSVSSILFSCTTQPVVSAVHRSGDWSAKAQVTDLSNGKTQQVSLEIIAVWPQKLRIDATAMLGIHVAVLAVDQGHFQLILPREKKYYEGPNSEKALQNFFKIAINPEWLIRSTFDQDIKGPDWTCQNLPADDEAGRGRVCKNSQTHISVTWKDKRGDQKRVIWANSTHEVQIVYKSYSEWDATKVQEDGNEASPFKLAVPEGFTKYNIM